MKKKVFVHIGYPKTATTTLQNHYFPELRGISYLGKQRDGKNKGVFGDWTEEIKSIQREDIDSIEKISKKFSADLHEKTGEMAILLSNEAITSSSIVPQRSDKGFCPTTTPFSAARSTRRLFDESLFDVKIVVVIRRQYDALPSCYAQYFMNHYSHIPNVNTFQKFMDDFFCNSGSYPRLGFDYLRSIGSFVDFFGEENVHVLPFELFKKDKQAFLKSFFGYIGVEADGLYEKDAPAENVRLMKDGSRRPNGYSFFDLASTIKGMLFPGLHLGMEKHPVTRVLRSIRLPFQANAGVIKLSKPEEDKIKEIYRLSNEELSERYLLHLGELGYY